MIAMIKLNYFSKKIKMTSVIVIITILVFIVIIPFVLKEENTDQSFRALPRPIGSEPLLITSAGQSTDIYVIKDIANKLMIDNYFIPMATKEQIRDVQSVILVIGYSDVGIRLNDLNFEKEKERIELLVEGIREKELKLITVYLRGSRMLTEENKQLLEIAVNYSDYLIVAENHNNYDYYNELAKKTGVPVTIVNNVNEVSEPIVSVFR